MKLLRLLAVFLAAAPVFAQTPEVDAVLDKAGDYVATYERTFVGVVAEETYRQEVRGSAGADPRGFPTEARSQRRDLRSDMLLVPAPAGDRWRRVLSSELVAESSAFARASTSPTRSNRRWDSSCRARCARSTR